MAMVLSSVMLPVAITHVHSVVTVHHIKIPRLPWDFGLRRPLRRVTFSQRSFLKVMFVDVSYESVFFEWLWDLPSLDMLAEASISVEDTGRIHEFQIRVRLVKSKGTRF